MMAPWEALPQIRNFLQLDFLFSGLEVSSTAIFAARAATLLILAAAVAFGAFRIVMKILDCLQTFLDSVTRLPKSFFILLILVIPLSADSLGARWSGYIVLAISVAALALLSALLMVIWKYGVDQTLRLMERIRPAGRASEPADREAQMPPENTYRPLMDPPPA